MDSNGKKVRYNLDEAAAKIGISKKSLDDYLLQLRFGKRCGYDFHYNKDQKVGHLRAFVRSKKKLIRTLNDQ